jgi:hypothetical protein
VIAISTNPQTLFTLVYLGQKPFQNNAAQHYQFLREYKSHTQLITCAIAHHSKVNHYLEMLKHT